MSHPTHERGVDSYRPHYRRDHEAPPPPPSDMFRFRGAAQPRDRRGANGRSEFTFRAKPKISERPLLRSRHGYKEEQVLDGMLADGDKFRNLDELTDSDEAEMEDSDSETNARPSKKRSRLDEDHEVHDQPKWSNPDPYTALPAPNETTGKKLDFVKLIRKARNTGAKQSNINANDDDFISFDDLDAPNGVSPEDTFGGLGKRKRGDPGGAKTIRRRGKEFYADGMVLEEWNVCEGIPATPWLQPHQDTMPGLALHKEILDFYEWVRPREYEGEVREGVIRRLSQALSRVEPGELKAFGSFAAGLYLPTGDMDLVYLPRHTSWRRNMKDGVSPSAFRRYGDLIRSQNLAAPGSIHLIPRAKVPIIKFVERVSGLKVDLSFNNDTGVVANQTFLRWKEKYPAMPILTSVIKHFLMIRGLNDVSIGGLGGFSTICLVTSIIQHMPLSGTPPNLGHLLLEFFNIYGNLFDRRTVGIRLDPPGYIDKKSYMPHLYNKEKEDRLMIVDPNRPDNNISGGSHEIERVFRCFSRAHDVLQTRLADFEKRDQSPDQAFSFLEDLIGGNFEAYREQRDILYELHYGRKGPAPAVIPPPPPPIAQDPLPPPPPPPPPPTINSATKKSKPVQAARGNENPRTDAAGTQASLKTTSKKATKAERRAARLKSLRPELSQVIGDSIGLVEALRIGQYKDYNEMDKDLTRRETEKNSD